MVCIRFIHLTHPACAIDQTPCAWGLKRSGGLALQVWITGNTKVLTACSKEEARAGAIEPGAVPHC
jgi:hypothetical protein